MADIFGLDLKKVGKVIMITGGGIGSLYIGSLINNKYVKTPATILGSAAIGYAGYEGYKLYKGLSGDGGSIPIEDIPDEDTQNQIQEELGKSELDMSFLNLSQGETLFEGHQKLDIRIENPTSISGKFILMVQAYTPDGDIKFKTKEVYLEPNSARDVSVTLNVFKDLLYRFPYPRKQCGFRFIAELWNRQYSRGCTQENPPCVRFGATEFYDVCLK